MSERDKPMDDETLQYPAKIASRVGLGIHEINAMKTKGCRFYGRKTSVKWVREYLAAVTRGSVAALSSELSAHRPHSISSKSCEPVATND